MHEYRPLSSWYYSPELKKIVPHHPLCTVEEIESYYCPQCLENFPSSEAMLYKNRCPRLECLACPCCSSVLTTVISHLEGTGGGAKTFLSCGHCYWDSVDNGFFAADGASLLMAIMDAERDHVGECLVVSRVSAINEQYGKLQRRKALEDRLKQRGTSSMRSSTLLQLARLEHGEQRDTLTYTSWEDAAKKELEKETGEKARKEQWNANMTEDISRIVSKGKEIIARKQFSGAAEGASKAAGGGAGRGSGGAPRNRMMSPPSAEAYEGYVGSGDGAAATSMAQRLAHPPTHPRTTLELTPQRRCLLTKRSLRCKETFERGNPGILLKPHINPLMGDTSTRTNVGNWFKKCSPARAFLPRVSICSYTFLSASEHYVELAMTNPSDEAVKVKLMSNNGALVGVTSGQKLILPTTEFFIHGYDEFADQDEAWTGEVEEGGIDTSNDPAALVFRKRNVVKLRLNISETDPPDDGFATLGFLLTVASPAGHGSNEEEGEGEREEDGVGTFAVKVEVRLR